MRYCPLVGGVCNKPESEIKAEPDTFFLAEPFQPKEERERRELVVSNILKETLDSKYSADALRFGDKDPQNAISCDICRLLQSSAYGIADISGANPNVLIELGMMLSLGKPVFVLCKKLEEENLRAQIPLDIVWKRVVPYEEFIDIQPELCKLIKNRPPVSPELSPGEETGKIIAEVDPTLAQEWSRKFDEFEQSQQEALKRLEELLKEAELDKAMPREREEPIPSSLEEIIKEILGKVEQREKVIGFPDDPKIAFLRGNFHYKRGEFEKAIELYDWAITLNPKLAEAWGNKGLALGNLERYKEEISCCDKAIELKPDYALAWVNKGNALGNLKRYEEALSCYDKAIELKPDLALAWVSKGNALGCLKRWKEARECYEEALRIEPRNISAAENLSEILLILGDFGEGVKWAEEAIKLAEEVEDKAISHFLLISALFLNGNKEKAQREIEGLVDYLKGLKESFKVTGWDFSPLLPTIEEKLEAGEKREVLSLVSLLNGEISLKDFEGTITSS